VSVINACSQATTVADAVSDLARQAGSYDAKAVLYFASSSYDGPSLAAAMAAAFPQATTFGCSTAGEITSGRMLKGSLVAMFLDASVVKDVAVAVVQGLADAGGLRAALEAFAEHVGQPAAALDFERYVGLILVDGLSGAEERLMDRLGDLTNVTFIGGSAGDDLKFAKTEVYANGKAYSDAAVLVLLEPTNGFAFIKTQSFEALDKQLVATSVDEAHRTVVEFNGKPALEAYAEAVGVPVAEAAGRFMRNPVGVMVGAEPYVRSPQRVDADKMVFYCNILQGMELRLLESTDIVQDTRNALQATLQALGPVSGVINFHCILRTLELYEKGQDEAYGKVFADVPTIGFSTYGEEYIGHINQTSTMLVLK
jgi:hypothetical protein